MQKKSLSIPLRPNDTAVIPANFSKHWPWIVLAAILLFVAVIRIRLLQIPLERDEGEFAYMGQLMLQGIPPYQLAYNMKLPGIYAAYALVMDIFGETISGIHLGLMVVNAIAVALLFLLTRRLFDDLAGVVAAASYALLSLSPSVLGTSAHATQFIVPFALGGTLLLSRALDSGKSGVLFASGLLYGLAFLMKQHAIFFIVFASVYFTWSVIQIHPLALKRLMIGLVFLVLGSSIPFVVSCFMLYLVGVFPKFWFWTFTYGSQYVSEVPLSEALQRLMILAPKAMTPWEILWGIAGIGLTAVFWNEKARAKRFFLIGFSLFSFLSICPGFFFRNHYFVTLLPAVGLLAGVAVQAAIQLVSNQRAVYLRMVPVLIIAAVMVGSIYSLRGFFFQMTPVEACRMMYGVNPFPESIEISEYIKIHSKEDDNIAVIGSEPQIYFYAHRKPATGYLYVYGLMEPHRHASRMQLEMIREIEKASPKYAVIVDVPTSWLRRPDSDATIFRWMEGYFKMKYCIAGFVEIFPGGHSKAYWDDEARNKRPTSRFNVFVLERKDS